MDILTIHAERRGRKFWQTKKPRAESQRVPGLLCVPLLRGYFFDRDRERVPVRAPDARAHNGPDVGAHLLMWTAAVWFLVARIRSADCEALYERRLELWKRCHAPEVYASDPSTCDAAFGAAEPDFLWICMYALFTF